MGIWDAGKLGGHVAMSRPFGNAKAARRCEVTPARRNAIFAASVRSTAMSMEEPEDDTVYRAVVNHEEQYSIWPEGRELPPGWNEAGKSGTKAEVLAWIEEVWTDMRPLSLRQKMQDAAPE
jgi:MbtH protein